MSRILALDYGRARCGCAVSDPTGMLATPAGVVREPDSDAGMAEIGRIVFERGIERVVVGLPVGLSGVEGEQAAAARDFAARLATVVEVPVETYDERFTTRLAERTPGRAPEDARAAAHLLEGYLARSRGEGR